MKVFSLPVVTVVRENLSKGLGCPVGAVLAGSKEFIEEAWRLKQRTGGAMRQAGIIAAAGVYALEHHVERLAEDHANAKLFAESLRNLPGVKVDPQTVETNIVFFDIAGTGMTADPFCDALKKKGIEDYQLDYAVKTLKRLAPAAPAAKTASRGIAYADLHTRKSAG